MSTLDVTYGLGDDVQQAARRAGLHVLDKLRGRRRVVVNTATTGSDFNAFNQTAFSGLCINGFEVTRMNDPHHALTLPPEGADGVVVFSLTLNAGRDHVCTAPVPREWRARMKLPSTVPVVHVHVDSADDEPVGVYSAFWSAMFDDFTLAAARSRGIRVGYTPRESLDPYS